MDAGRREKKQRQRSCNNLIFTNKQETVSQLTCCLAVEIVYIYEIHILAFHRSNFSYLEMH